jgi:beta-lactamase superfamily II metal-dependent hydrolase
MSNNPYDYEAIFFDVGQGDASLIREIATDKSVLIDAAKNGQKVCNFLKLHPKLKAIFVTHLDKDHIEGLPEIIGWLINNREEKTKIFINTQNDNTKIAKRFKRALKSAYNKGRIEIEAACNEKETVKKIKQIGGEFHILWPPYQELICNNNRNSTSLILRFQKKSVKILFGGDVQGNIWKQIDTNQLQANLLKYPHHGGKLKEGKNDWSAEELISNVAPKYIIVSYGKNNQHGHPSEEFKKAQKKFDKIKFFFTPDGTITANIKSNAGEINFEKSA